MPRTSESHPFRRKFAAKSAEASAARVRESMSSRLIASPWFVSEFLPEYLSSNREALLRVITVVRLDPDAERALCARLDRVDAPAIASSEAEVADMHSDPGRARPAHTLRSKRRHEAEDAWTAMSYYRRAAFWRALRAVLVDQHVEQGGESPEQIAYSREQMRGALQAERAVKEALRTKGRPSAALWIALPTPMQSLVLRRVRHIATDVRRGVEREAAAIAATILRSWVWEGAASDG